MSNKLLPEWELHQVEDENWDQYDILVLEDPESNKKIMETWASINEVLSWHLNIDWRCHRMVFIHPDSFVMNTEMIELHLDEMRIQKSYWNSEQRTKLKWEYGDEIIHSAKVCQIVWFYNSKNNHGFRPQQDWEISEIEGIWHDWRSVCYGSSLWIENKIFLPWNHTEFCNALVQPLAKELTDPTEYGWWLVRYNKIMEFWVAMCKSEDSDELKKIIKEMERWANREYQSILIIRKKRATLSTTSNSSVA